MINLDSITNKNNKKHNEKWQYIPDHPYRIIIIGGSGSEKTNALLNLINRQNDIDNIYLYGKDLGKPKCEFFIKNRENAGIRHLNDSNAFIECFNDCNSSRREKILIVFVDMIANIMTNKEFKAIIK